MTAGAIKWWRVTYSKGTTPGEFEALLEQGSFSKLIIPSFPTHGRLYAERL
jgi:hypothetical protein